MKKFVYSVLILLVCFAFIPWIDGLYFQHQFNHLITALNQDNRIRVNVIDYRRGWLHSHIKLSTIIVTSKTTSSTPIVLMFDEIITHGPLIYNKGQFFPAMAMIESKIILNKAGPSPGSVQITSIATFNGHWDNHISIPSMSIPFPAGGKLSWQGLEGHSDLKVKNDQIESIKSQFIFGLLSASSTLPANVSLTIQPITFSYQAKRHPIGLWIGHAEVLIPYFSFQNPAGKSILIQKFNFNTTSKVTANIFYDSTQKLTLQTLSLPEDIISSISPAALTITTSHLSAKGIVDLTHFLQNTNLDAMSTDDFQNQLLIRTSQLITPTSTLTCDASFSTAFGNFMLIGKIANMIPSQSTSLFDLAKTGAIHVDMRIAVPLANKIFESYFQTLASERALKPNDQSIEMLPDISPKNQSTDQVRVEKFNDSIAQLMKEGKLPLESSIKIMTLRNQELSPDAFNLELEKLHLEPAIMTQINSLYLQMLADQKVAEAQIKLSPMDKTKNTFDEWLAQGYLLQVGNDYTLSLVLENGVLKLNDKIINQH